MKKFNFKACDCFELCVAWGGENGSLVWVCVVTRVPVASFNELWH